MKKKSIIILVILALILIFAGLFLQLNKKEEVKIKEPEIEEKSKNSWLFRSLGTMNITKDEIGNYTPDQIAGLYTTNIKKTVEYAKEVNANYVELAIELNQKDNLEELYKYYKVLPNTARINNLNVYYRSAPTEMQKNEILKENITDEEFSNNCWKYFYDLEKLWFQMDNVLVENNDIISTWAEGDSYFTIAFGWGKGIAKYKEYIKVASQFTKYLEEKYNLELYYTESLSGGEARLRDEVDNDTGKYMDFILWDHYAGMMEENETKEQMKLEAAKTVEYIKKYSDAYNIKIGLGEWSTHWYNAKTKQEQYDYIKIMTDELDKLTEKNFVGMEYFHFALVSTKIDYEKAITYYSSPIVDQSGKFPAFDLLKDVYKYHTK